MLVVARGPHLVVLLSHVSLPVRPLLDLRGDIPSSEVKTLPLTAESIFWTTEMSPSTFRGAAVLGADGISKVPLSGEDSNLSCRWPCVSTAAIALCGAPLLLAALRSATRASFLGATP